MDLLESVDFGDWLVHEIAREKRPRAVSKCNYDRQARIDMLENAKALLLQFLVEQDSLLKAAAQMRAEQANRNMNRRSAS